MTNMRHSVILITSELGCTLLQVPTYISDVPRLLESVGSSAPTSGIAETANEPAASRIQPAPMSTPTKQNLVDEPLNINQLPNEILEHIFEYLFVLEWKKVRLVCRRWYNLCSRNGDLYINKHNFHPREHLENCGFKRLAITFSSVLPAFTWQTIGSRIHKLHFEECALGDNIVENVILQCENLESLVIFPVRFRTWSFCSAEMLEGLNVQRRKLKSFSYFIPTETLYGTEMEIETWKRVFSALFRIFPNVTRCSLKREVGVYYPRPSFSCAFSKEFNELVEPAMVDVVTHSLSYIDDDCTKALNSLSRLRLVSIELGFSKSSTDADVVALNNLFADQKKVKSVKLNLKIKQPEILTRLFFSIVDGCPELQELEFNRGLPFFDCFTESDMHRFHAKAVQLNKLSIDYLYRSSQSLEIVQNEYKIDQNQLFIVFQKYAHLEHVKIQMRITDVCFQKIFQFMVNLKSLEVILDVKNRGYAFSGRPPNSHGDSARDGYSISRLGNLERLVLHVDHWIACDEMFFEFHFPKLRYLQCRTPENFHILEVMTGKIPSLKELHFSHSRSLCTPESLNSLITLCVSMPDLRTITLHGTRFKIDDMKMLFKRCFSLKVVNTEKGHIYYDPFSKEVRSTFTDDDDGYRPFSVSKRI